MVEEEVTELQAKFKAAPNCDAAFAEILVMLYSMIE
jgi:hypothetical protein